MKVAIRGGTGPEGAGLALRWALAGHEVIIGSRQAERAKAKAAELSQQAKGTKIFGMANREAAAAGARGGGAHAPPAPHQPPIQDQELGDQDHRALAGALDMQEAPVLVSHSRLREFISRILGALGMPPHIVEPTARLMVG